MEYSSPQTSRNSGWKDYSNDWWAYGHPWRQQSTWNENRSHDGQLDQGQVQVDPDQMRGVYISDLVGDQLMEISCDTSVPAPDLDWQDSASPQSGKVSSRDSFCHASFMCALRCLFQEYRQSAYCCPSGWVEQTCSLNDPS
eukprot:1869998-Amphidinium_carterae.1